MRLINKDNLSSFKELLEKDHPVAVHYENLQVLVTEIKTATDFIKDAFGLKEPPYKLQSESNHFTRQDVKTSYYGLLSIRHLAQQI